MRLILALIFLSAMQAFGQRRQHFNADSAIKNFPAAYDAAALNDLLTTTANAIKKPNGNTVAALHFGVNKAQQKNLFTQQGLFYAQLAALWEALNKSDSVIYYFEKANHIFETTGSSEDQAVLLNDYAAYFLNRLNKHGLAADYFKKAVVLAEKNNNDSLLVIVNKNLAHLYDLQQDKQTGFLYAKKSVDYALKTKNKKNEADAYLNLASHYLIFADSAAALKTYNDVLRRYMQLKDSAGIASVYQNLALIEGNNSIESAIGFCLKAKNIWDKVDPLNKLAIINNGNIGYYYKELAKNTSNKTDKTNYFIKAKEALQQTIEKSRSAGIADDEAYWTGVLAETQAETGDYKNAYENFHKFYDGYDTIFSQDSKNKIAAVESQKNIELKNEQLKTSQIALANQNKIKIGLLLLVALLGIIGALLFYQNKTRKKTNTTLLQLNTQLDEANKIKAKFFAILGHDLRTPVANLVSYLHLQKNAADLLPHEIAAEQNKKITASAENLLTTMEDMLLWSKHQMVQFKPQIKKVPVTVLFNHIQSFFANVQNIHFEFNNEEALELYTDENYIKTIMQNLTANAVKAVSSTPNAVIAWKAWKENEKIMLSVTDNGPGINPDIAKALFTEDAVYNTKTGFGIQIIKDLAKAIELTVALKNTSAAGSTFILASA